MKLNRLISNANIILNSNNLQYNLLHRNPSYLSLSNNNENNKSNISITTNASAVKINSPRNYTKLALPTSPKSILQKNFLHSGSLALLSPTTSRIKPGQLRIMEEADDIMKERFKNKNIITNNIKKKSKLPAIKLGKDISLKNFIISLLQEKRTEINEKERLMNNALIEFKNQFNEDYKAFNEYTDDVKKKQKILDDLIHNLKVERDQKEQILNEKVFEYKSLEDFCEKMIKLIYNSNKYAIFFNQVFELPFNYKNLPELNRHYNFEKIVDHLVNIYETKDKDVPLPSILKDENILMQKYTEMEDIILHMLEYRDLIVNEIHKNRENYERDLKILENNKKEYEKDLNYLKEEVNIVKKSMRGLIVQDPSEIDEFIDFIIELGKEITDKIPIKRKSNNGNNNNGYLLYCRKVLLTLEEKEVNINKYINEIESILNYGENYDKNLVENCIIEIKKINKKENQLKLLRKKEQLENEKNLRYMKRAQRIVVKGRQASPIFPLIKYVKKIKKLSINKKENEIECVYSHTDDEKE